MAINPPQPPQVPETPSASSISCYRAVTQSSLVAQAQAIAGALSAIGRVSSADALFALTPDRRGFGYVDASAMFRSGAAAGLPSTAAEAEAEARAVVQRVNAALGKEGTLAALKVATLLPTDLQLLNVAPVYHPSELSVDHWLCRFVPMLRSRHSAPPSAVSGATVEVRIGSERRMLGLTARWSPVDQEMLCSPIASPDPRQLDWTAQARERAAIEATDVVDDGGALLTYALVQAPSGEAWLLPCHVFAEDPLQRRYPAAQHRLNDCLQATG